MPGLREQKRALVRRQLAEAALRLFLQRGYEATTVEDIANAASVSRATFFRYFETKDDAVLSQLDAVGADLIAAYRARPLDEHPWDSLKEVLLHAAARITDPDRMLALLELTWTTPSLRARRLDKTATWRSNLTALTRERMGCDDRDPLPILLVHAALAAGESALGAWAATLATADLAHLLNNTFTTLGAGLDHAETHTRQQ
ncbi:TetR family transcriptional regulator [Saccharopolyspora sp. NPDC000995]